MPGAAVINFGPFLLDPQRKVLMRGTETLPIRRQSFDVLHYLIENRERVVANADVVSAVWPIPPSKPDASVTQCVKDIRKVFGPDHSWIVRTVSGSGYQFVADVTATIQSDITANTEDRTREAAAAVPNPLWRSPLKLFAPATLLLALLALAAVFVTYQAAMTNSGGHGAPLAMMAEPSISIVSGHVTPEQALPLAQSYVEELTAVLRGAPRGYDLAIKSPVPARQAIDVRYLGRVGLNAEVSPGLLTIQLIESPSGRQVWSGSFPLPAEPSERSKLTARIVRSIVVEIRTAENLRPLPQKVEAGHYALQGRALMEGMPSRQRYEQALVLFDKALSLDPGHLQSLAGFARLRINLVQMGWATGEAAKANLEAAQRAVSRMSERNPNFVAAHVIRSALARVRGDAESSAASLRHALILNPDYPLIYAELGRTLVELGDPREGLELIEKSIDMSPTDPVLPTWYLWAGIAAAYDQDHRSSLKWLVKAQHAEASQRVGIHLWLAISFAMTGDVERAKSHLAEFTAHQPAFSTSAWLKKEKKAKSRLVPVAVSFAQILLQLGAPP